MENLLNVSKIAFSIGGKDIYWYGIIMCAAIILAILVAMLLCKKKKLNTELPLNIALVVVPTGILGARLFACLFDSSLSINDFFNFRTGGMSIIGAIVFGGLALIIYMIIKKVKNPFIYLDILCTVLILAQAIGRWGNYFNQELYGGIIEEDSLFATFPFAVFIEKTGCYHQALFFYEFAANLVGFFILANLFAGCKIYGFATALYLIFYGTIRAILEPMRQTEFILTYGDIAVSSLMSYIMIAVGIILFFGLFIWYERRRKNGEKIKRNG